MRVTSTEVQNNFGRYLNLAAASEEVIITKNGRDMAKIVKCHGESTVNEELAFYESENGTRITYEEFLQMTEKSDLRYEFIDGEVFAIATPGYAHQAAISAINGRFYNWFRGKKCRSLTSPFEVVLVKESGGKNVVQPDIVVICDSGNIDGKGKYKGIPSLVVEVLSSSSKKHDMLRKLFLYAQTGIKEYWIVDTYIKAVYLYCLENEDDLDITVFKNEESVRSVIFKGLEIPLDEIFE